MKELRNGSVESLLDESKQLSGFEDPSTRVEYDIYIVCSLVKDLIDTFDRGEYQEPFFTKQATEDLNVAALRLTSLASTLINTKFIN